MKTHFTRRVAGVVGFAAVAAFLTVSAGTANAAPAGTPTPGSVTLSPANGNSGNNFQVVPETGAFCPGSGANNYRYQTFIVPSSVDVKTMQWGPTGIPTSPAPAQNLRNATGTRLASFSPAIGNDFLAQQTASFANVVFSTLPAGSYKIGFACTLPEPVAGAFLTTEAVFQTTLVVTASTGAGPNNFTYATEFAPVAPVLNSPLTASNNTLAGTFSQAASTPLVTGFTVTAQPQPSGTPVTLALPASATSFSLGGLTNGTAYSVTITSANSAGTSLPSNAVTGTPTNAVTVPAPSPFTAQNQSGSIILNWTPAAVPGGATLVNHIVTVSPSVAGSPFTVPAGTNTLTVTAAPGSYQFTIQATYTPSNFVGAVSSSVTGSSLASQVLIQDLTVVRPVGALVLTQRCGVYGSLPVYTDNVFGTLPAVGPIPANADPGPTGYAYGGLPVGTAPSTPNAGGPADPLFPQYPYPTLANGDATANYPTHCGVDMGIGKLITSGPRAGQYFTANGRMNQVTVVNTQDVDGGFTVNGTMSDFTRTGGGDSFSGNLLGWDPKVTYDSAPNLDGYDMVLVAGGARQPEATASLTGLGAPFNATNTQLQYSLAKVNGYVAATNTGSLGMGVIDARLRLLIPVAANSGTYTGTLTLTTV